MTGSRLATALEMEAYGIGETAVKYRLCCLELSALMYGPGHARASVISEELQAGWTIICLSEQERRSEGQ